MNRRISSKECPTVKLIGLMNFFIRHSSDTCFRCLVAVSTLTLNKPLFEIKLTALRHSAVLFDILQFKPPLLLLLIPYHMNGYPISTLATAPFHPMLHKKRLIERECPLLNSHEPYSFWSCPRASNTCHPYGSCMLRHRSPKEEFHLAGYFDVPVFTS